MIFAIWCMTKNRVLGYKNKLPWHEPEEFAHYKRTVTNQAVLMGRVTYDDLGGEMQYCKKLYVLSRKTPPKHLPKHVSYVSDYKKIIEFYQSNPQVDLFVSGGEQVYTMLWNQYDYLLVSILKKEYQGDIVLPELPMDRYALVATKDFPTYTFYKYKKI